MNIITTQIDSSVLGLLNIAKADDDKVKFTSGNVVRFKVKSDGTLELRSIESNYSYRFVSIFDSCWDRLTVSERTMLIAAAVKLGKPAVVAGREVISIVNAMTFIATGIYMTQPEQPTKHATSWEPAQKFGISGHRREPVSRPKEPTRSSSSSSTSTGGLLLGLAAIAVIGILGAATSNKN